MAEPHSTVVAGALYGAGLSSVTVLLGAQIDALVAGLVAAILVSIWLDTINNRTKAAAAVLFSALLAGYGSSSAAELFTANVAGVPNTDSLRMLMALIIGAAAPTIVPIVIGTFGKWVGGKA